MTTDSETTETFRIFGVPRALAGYFSDSTKKTAHLFPGKAFYHFLSPRAKTLFLCTDMWIAQFELMGMFACFFRAPESLLIVLPNPTNCRWARYSFAIMDLIQHLRARHDQDGPRKSPDILSTPLA